MKGADIVRVIPSNYHELSKGFFNYQDRWEAADANKNRVIMLGGKYQILDSKRDSSGEYIKLIHEGENNLDWVHRDYVRPNSIVELCPFKVGDKVSISMSETKIRENASLLQLYDWGSGIHIVRHVLNDYYVFIDVLPSDQKAFPFEWRDLSLVDAE